MVGGSSNSHLVTVCWTRNNKLENGHTQDLSSTGLVHGACLSFLSSMRGFLLFYVAFFAIVDRNNVPIKAVSVEPTHHELNLRPVSRSNLNNLNNVWSSQWWSLSLLTYFI